MTNNEHPDEESEASQVNTDESQTDELTGVAEEDGEVKLLEDARAKADEHWDLYMRTQADLENLRKRAERDLQNAHKYGIEKFVNELLPVFDSMELGMASANVEDEAVKSLVEGLQLTTQMFQLAIEKFGVKAINPEGEIFNPEFHQAMSMQETTDAKPNTILAVMQKGYVLNERLVRPAMVVVAKAPVNTDNSGEDG